MWQKLVFFYTEIKLFCNLRWIGGLGGNVIPPPGVRPRKSLLVLYLYLQVLNGQWQPVSLYQNMHSTIVAFYPRLNECTTGTDHRPQLTTADSQCKKSTKCVYILRLSCTGYDKWQNYQWKTRQVVKTNMLRPQLAIVKIKDNTWLLTIPDLRHKFSNQFTKVKTPFSNALADNCQCMVIVWF